MRYITEHIHRIIGTYKGGYPLASWLKSYYKEHHQLGSRDRKAISEAVFLYYRFKNRLPESEDAWHTIEQASLHAAIQSPYLKKVLESNRTEHLQPAPLTTTIKMPEFSEGIDKEEWISAFATQPALFIRVRQNGSSLCSILEAHDIPFEKKAADILKLPNSSAINQWLPEEAYVIQDLSSQESVHRFAAAVKQQFPDKAAPTIWDVCSGAGGKTIFIKDYLPQARMTCSDIRKNILQNLKARTEGYHQKDIHTMVLNSADAHEIQQKMGSQQFDAIICDVPCSGSGTWQRTPENWAFMDMQQLNSFPKLQFTIAGNALRRLKTGGIFAYITCSVFKQENEQVVEQLIHAQPNLQILHQGILNGLRDQADSLYCALFTR